EVDGGWLVRSSVCVLEVSIHPCCLPRSLPPSTVPPLYTEQKTMAPTRSVATLLLAVWVSGGAKAVMVSTGVTFRRLTSDGHCGQSQLVMQVASLTQCAAVCAREPACEGFSSTRSSVSQYRECATIHNVTPTDLDPYYLCYVRGELIQPDISHLH
ncbi:hypothetical protein Hamer_G010960, partial [Homarus americanus]